jgi:hypothetical protein
MSDYDCNDYDDPRERAVSELENVHSTLTEILSELQSRPYASGPFWFSAFIVFLVLGSWSGSKLDRWTDKAWYSMNYGAEFKNITVEKRPLDCDFLHVPMGGKGCEYKKRTSVFGPAERKALVQQSATPEEQRRYEQQPHSVSVYWEKQED